MIYFFCTQAQRMGLGDKEWTPYLCRFLFFLFYVNKKKMSLRVWGIFLFVWHVSPHTFSFALFLFFFLLLLFTHLEVSRRFFCLSVFLFLLFLFMISSFLGIIFGRCSSFSSFFFLFLFLEGCCKVILVVAPLRNYSQTAIFLGFLLVWTFI